MVFIIKNFINNEFADPINKDYIDSFNPSTTKLNAKVPDSEATDVDKAVVSAKSAFQKWSTSSPQYRANILNNIADLIEERLDEFAALEAQDQGKPVLLAKTVDIPRAVYNFRFFASAILHSTNTCTKLNEIPFASGNALNYVDRMPVGVAGLISPWNLPLYLLTWKIAPAIAFGNTCVAKPSEVTSVTAWLLCKVLKASSLPAGVVNIVFGSGKKAGDALVKHKNVPLVSFTGSTTVGKHIIASSSEYCKKLSLELGGKNSAILFEDVNLEKSLPILVKSAFTNQGEVCLCTSRIFVHENIFDSFISKYTLKVRELKVGAVDDSSTKCGALVSKQHYDKVKKYISMARDSGAKLWCGDGVDELVLTNDISMGYFIQPTVISGLNDDHPCMKEEIFGPVVCVTSFKSENEVSIFIKKFNNFSLKIEKIRSSQLTINLNMYIYLEV